MPTISIDNQPLAVDPGSTVLDAARKLGIDIPALCYLKGVGQPTSCLVCLVKVNGKNQLVPSCATKVEEGMQVESETVEVHEARRTAMELLLSDHLGDCMSPCHRICPLDMNIPQMIRHINAGNLRDAILTVKSEIPFPAILGRVCHKPCEGGCRRVLHDDPVSVAMLERHVGDAILTSDPPFLPQCDEPTGRRVVIVGAGPTGLSAAYFLLQWGHECTLFDDGDQPGGSLRHALSEQELPRDVLNAEVGLLIQLGAQFQGNTVVGERTSLEDLRRDYDAVLLATGKLSDGNPLGLETSDHGFKVAGGTHETSIQGVFAAGEAVRGKALIVRSMADGKAAAVCINQYLSGAEVTGPYKPFSSMVGKLLDGEIDRFMVDASDAPRSTPTANGYTIEEACTEGTRCLHCDCRAAGDCLLRQYAESYKTNQKRFKGERRVFEQNDQHPDIIHEPGKCIACGRCVLTAEAAREELGLTFIGRGFNVRVGVPFNHSISEGLQKVADECVVNCPTGALAMRDDGEVGARE